MRLRLLLIMATLFVSLNVGAEVQNAINVPGYCQNLTVNGNDMTKSCGGEYQRLDYESGRVNYLFWSKTALVVFSGSNDEVVGDNYLSSIVVDKVYVNEKEYFIDGMCFLFGNSGVGVSVSCRSNDNGRRFSALFFSYGNTQKLVPY